MESPLAGRTILVVEDEPLLALDVAEALQAAGARVLTARSLRDALIRAEERTLSAAVLDHRLNEGDSTQICERLEERGIPFVIYSGYTKLDGACGKGELVQKPVHPDALVATVVGLLAEREA